MKKFIIMLFVAAIFFQTNVPATNVRFTHHKIDELVNNKWFQNNVRECIKIADKYNYLDYIIPVFKKHGLPYDLVYLPVIESCFNPQAKSGKGAVGMWQINDITARHVGLRKGFLTDERFNWQKSTVAAAKYLVFLRERFDSWVLVLASYNVGPTYLKEQIKKQKTTDINLLKLPRETREYIYKFIAMIQILKKERV